MRARVPGGNGGQNMNAMLKQAQKMQDDMKNLQADIEEREFTASAAGGMVEVTLNGRHELQKIHINPEIVDPEDTEMLEDYLTIAFNEAVKNIAETQETEMGAITGGLNIPGLF